ncbi:hypothetical protein BJ508DRAFT_372953 [Ascobolus immersus RN42]|uniref:Uncharacterized protein n=1 Tax=Ascobolus immersus RN42 TaxID=1160509 RepID=A0A3N4IX28_ASCIM|nr:hypothetical protein BJ508DRAFT_372953 [Ascobolus immersus RN42]
MSVSTLTNSFSRFSISQGQPESTGQSLSTLLTSLSNFSISERHPNGTGQTQTLSSLTNLLGSFSLSSDQPNTCQLPQPLPLKRHTQPSHKRTTQPTTRNTSPNHWRVSKARASPSKASSRNVFQYKPPRRWRDEDTDLLLTQLDYARLCRDSLKRVLHTFEEFCTSEGMYTRAGVRRCESLTEVDHCWEELGVVLNNLEFEMEVVQNEGPDYGWWDEQILEIQQREEYALSARGRLGLVRRMLEHIRADAVVRRQFERAGIVMPERLVDVEKMLRFL